ncbi:MAG TPA: polymer-forming cytoskeletal protein [Methylomirabilota bacterium]
MRWRRSGKAAIKSNSDLSAYIDEASEIEGKYTFSGTVMLNGKLTGEIFSNDTLIIGEKGVVNAAIHAGIVLVSGEVRGNILGTERVELRGSARVYGDVEAPVVVVEEGVLFEGHCRMTRGRPEGVSGDPPPQRDLSIVSAKR